MNHIVDTCPLTKFEGGLNLLHEADDDAVIWLESRATAAVVTGRCSVLLRICVQDSYVLDYFTSMQRYLSAGSPVYFVVEDGHNYTSPEGQNLVCGGSGCPETSLLGQVYEATRQPNK